MLLLAAAASAAMVLLPFGKRDEEPVQRDAFALPSPGAKERVETFFRLIASGERVDLGGDRPSAWQEIGELALSSLGPDAAEFLLDEARTAEYRASPDLLSTVMRILPDIPGALEKPRLLPFLFATLAELDARPVGGQEAWKGDLRRLIFTTLHRAADPRAVAVCQEELARGPSAVDLRATALGILLRLGRADLVVPLYDALPPNDREPKVFLRMTLLDLFLELASPGTPGDLRRQLLVATPLLERLTDAPLALERIRAQGCLLRMGRSEMAARLAAEYESHIDDPQASWYALQTLAQEQAHPLCREVFLQTLRHHEAGIEGQLRYDSSVAFLSWRWIEDGEVQKELWQLLETSEIPPGNLLAALVRIDRKRVGDLLQRELASSDQRHLSSVLNFIRTLPFPEAGPWILERLRRAETDAERAFYYGILTGLRTEGIAPLLRAELSGGPSQALREVAAGCLLDLSDPEGIARLSELLREEQPDFLDAVLQRAHTSAREGLPPSLQESLAWRLRHSPGELDRRRVLYALRLAARLPRVREAMMEAYRHEPSLMLAREIRRVMIEMAHR